MVKEIADVILNHCDRPYSHFAIGTALQIIAGCAQGGYSLPALGASGFGMSLSLYQWFVAPAAAGKDAYQRACITYLTEVDSRLRYSDLGSAQGLRSQLFCFNSGTLVIDEFQDEMAKLAKASQSYSSQILTDLKLIANDLPKLPAVALSRYFYPAVQNPRLSLMGLGTTEGFRRVISDSIVGGGFLSRFTVWPVVQPSERVYHSKLMSIPKSHEEFLGEIFRQGLTAEGHMQDYEKELKNFLNMHDHKVSLIHKPQNDPMGILFSIQADAISEIKNYTNEVQKKYLSMHANKKLSGADFSSASILDRSPRIAYKAAGIHAIGRGNVSIDATDMRFGIALARLLTGWLANEVDQSIGFVSHEFARLAKIKSWVLESLRGSPKSYKELFRSGNFPTNEVKLALCELSERGMVFLELNNGIRHELTMDVFKQRLPNGHKIISV
jgi:hypothetical protein